MSPQIRQYLRLLQLPLAELRNTIEEELAENPVLEEVSADPAEDSAAVPPNGKPKDEKGTEELRFDGPVDSLAKLDSDLPDGLYPNDDLSMPEQEEFRRQRDYQESLITKKESLSDFLIWQCGFLELTESELAIAEEIIGNLSDDGYLRIAPEEMAQSMGCFLSEVEKVLKAVQGLDPPGIAGRNLQETLLIQLERKGPEAELAKKIVQEYFLLLEKKQWDHIAKKTKATLDEIQQAAKLIAHLDPKPGRTFYGDDSLAVIPDAAVDFDDSDPTKLVVEIHDENLPEIRISPYYRRLLRDPTLDATSRKFLKEKLQAAIDFVKALSQRRTSLRDITDEIVKAQPEFFEKGFSHLKPLRLKDISERLRIHESTVSRAIQGKYISTPQGTLPYKSFFSSKLDRTEGGVESQKSMMEKIRALIQSEDPKNPLSDEAITKILYEEGVKIARRTVAKYRELLKVLPSHLRRKQ
ncbi:MAG: RNA polymerase factor sigma-54 [Candidatus Omnitrophica bacterium]|nr:RNA polymerase factor sigma-54 [Candidatus Omnitrophota bacterium]